MPREWLRYSTRARRREAAAKIRELLPEDGSESGWGDLEKRAVSAGISSATLSFHLKRLGRLGLVRRRVDASTYPPRTYYSLAVKRSQPPPELTSLQNQQRWLESSVKVGTATEDFYMILRGYIFRVVSSAADILFEALGIRREALFFMDIDELNRKTLLGREKAHERADELVDAWLRPGIHETIDLCYVRSPKTRKPLMEEIRDAWLLYPLIQMLLTDSKILGSLERDLAQKAKQVGLHIPSVEGFKSPVWQLLTMPLADLAKMSNEEFRAKETEILRNYDVYEGLLEYLRRQKLSRKYSPVMDTTGSFDSASTSCVSK